MNLDTYQHEMLLLLLLLLLALKRLPCSRSISTHTPTQQYWPQDPTRLKPTAALP
jgi:hypothetical protein